MTAHTFASRTDGDEHGDLGEHLRKVRSIFDRPLDWEEHPWPDDAALEVEVIEKNMSGTKLSDESFFSC